jgi:hypothetical protein
LLNMASESGLPNNKAARDLPLQRCGIKAQAGVPMEACAVTCRQNWVVTRSSSLCWGWSFFLPVSAILIFGFQIYHKIIFKKERYVL